MGRYRLKFLFQELDLVGPEVVIGRSPDCHITLEDPLVSRRHAIVRIGDDEVRVVDLGSRNGVKINGEAMRGERVLRDGDRLRIGTQEFVFSSSTANRAGKPQRPTGTMRVCLACHTPFPGGVTRCPHCGVVITEYEEGETLSGIDVDVRRVWALDLISEVIDRALGEGRVPEADRVMQRAAREIDERRTRGERLAAPDILAMAVFAVRLARLVRSPDWLAWALNLHKYETSLPSAPFLDLLENAVESGVEEVRPLVHEFLVWWQSQGRGMVTDDVTSIPRLERLARPAGS